MSKNKTADPVNWLSSNIDWLRNIDPKVARFDDHEVEAMLMELSDMVVDLFGHGSPEFEKFHEYRICMGTWSMKDSSSDKQAKFEQGIPKAVKDFEELLEAVYSIQASSKEEAPQVSEKKAGTDTAATQKAKTEKKKTPPQAKPQPPVAEPKADKAVAPPPKETPEKPKEKKQVGDSNSPSAVKKPSGEVKVLLLHSGEDEMTVSVIDLLDKLAVDTVMPDANQETSAEYMGEVAAVPKVSFTIYLLNPDEKALFPGLPGKISKAKPRQDTVFELGLLVGKLGRDRVAVLYRKEKGIDIPDDFFGVNYVAYDVAGGWKINLIKLLKASGFEVDANILFE